LRSRGIWGIGGRHGCKRSEPQRKQKRCLRASAAEAVREELVGDLADGLAALLARRIAPHRASSRLVAPRRAASRLAPCAVEGPSAPCVLPGGVSAALLQRGLVQAGHRQHGLAVRSHATTTCNTTRTSRHKAPLRWSSAGTRAAKRYAAASASVEGPRAPACCGQRRPAWTPPGA